MLKENSVSLGCWIFMLKHTTTFLIWITPNPGTFTSKLGIMWSGFDSVIPIIAVLVLLTMYLVAPFFEIFCMQKM